MTAEPDDAVKRRGRPPATDSTDTWCTILDVSRRLFAERGYSAVTNKDLAAAAGVTTSALYHYVESKLDLYVAVHRDVLRRIGRRFNDALASSDTFVGKVQAVLEASSAMNGSDPSFAQFTGVVRADMRRFPEIAERLAHERGADREVLRRSRRDRHRHRRDRSGPIATRRRRSCVSR